MRKNNKSEIKIGKVIGDVTISQNQKGGITSHEINTEGNKKLPIRRIIVIIGAIASLVTILTFFGFKPSEVSNMKKNDEDKISIGDVNGDVVISQNQTGGITAGTVNNYNISNIQRSLSNKSDHSKLSQFSNIKVYLHWQADDNETVLFKNSIYQYLLNANWQVIQSAGHTSDSSVQNVIFDINSTLPNDSTIVLAANMLISIFNENNITAHILKNPDNHLDENEMYIRIGAIQ